MQFIRKPYTVERSIDDVDWKYEKLVFHLPQSIRVVYSFANTTMPVYRKWADELKENEIKFIDFEIVERVSSENGCLFD